MSGADDRANPPQQFSFGVGKTVDHRRAMQIEIDAVQWSFIQRHRKQARNSTPRSARTPHPAPGRRDWRNPMPAERSSRPRLRRGRSLPRPARTRHATNCMQCRSVANRRKSARFDKVSISGRTRGEGMALVQKSANRDSHRLNSTSGSMGPLPANTAAMLSSARNPIAFLVSREALPTCGDRITLSRLANRAVEIGLRPKDIQAGGE